MRKKPTVVALREHGFNFGSHKLGANPDNVLFDPIYLRMDWEYWASMVKGGSIPLEYLKHYGVTHINLKSDISDLQEILYVLEATERQFGNVYDIVPEYPYDFK